MNTTEAPRLGAVFSPDLPPELLRPIAKAAESSGLDELWLSEDSFKEGGIAQAAAALSWTERIPVGIGFLPAPFRNVAATAMEIATLHRLFPDRLTTTVGHGFQPWMAQAGAKVASPLTLLEEYAVNLRRLLAGEQVSYDGRYVQLQEVRLDWPPNGPTTVMLGAAGPKSLALAGRIGDGTVLALGLTDEGIRDAIEAITTAHAAAGKSGRPEIALSTFAATGPRAQELVDAEAAAWGMPPELGLGLAGDAKVFAEWVRKVGDYGITAVNLLPTRTDPDPGGFVRFLGQQVRPLLG